MTPKQVAEKILEHDDGWESATAFDLIILSKAYLANLQALDKRRSDFAKAALVNVQGYGQPPEKIVAEALAIADEFIKQLSVE